MKCLKRIREFENFNDFNRYPKRYFPELGLLEYSFIGKSVCYDYAMTSFFKN